MSIMTLGRKHPVLLSLAGVIAVFVSLAFGTMPLFLVGFPTLFICCGIAAGARRPSRIPLKDALIYVGISIAIVIGAVLYAIHSD
jgi:hypothetical protein